VIGPETAELLRSIVGSEISRMNSGASKEYKRQTKRLAKLQDERTSLLRAHLADAVPLDLMRSEQDRIASEMAQARSSSTGCRVRLTWSSAH
jgi:hypothetical protein